MKIEITKDGKVEQIELKGLKGRDVNSLLDLGLKVKDAKEEESSEYIKDIMRKQDEIAARISNMSVDELNDLDIEDKAKIINYISERTQNAMGFMNPSQK